MTQSAMRWVFLLLLAACGENNHDPLAASGDRENSDSKSQPERAELDEAHLPSSVPDEDTLCLSSCSIPDDVSFGFTVPVPLNPDGCSAQDLHVFDHGFGLMIFFLGDCSDDQQVYAYQTSYEGGNFTIPTLLSRSCTDSARKASQMSVTQGKDGFAVVFLCGDSSNTYEVFASIVGSQGNHLVTVPIEEFEAGIESWHPMQISKMSYQVSWNSVSKEYAAVRRGRMQRFDSNGTLIGGAIVVAAGQDSGVSQVRVMGGEWFILRGGRDLYGPGAYCSKVNQDGILLCNDVYLGTRGSGLESKSHFLSSAQNGSIILSTFDEASCSIKNNRLLAEATNAQQSVHGYVSLNATYGGRLSVTQVGTLTLTTYTLVGPLQSWAPISIANVNAVSQAGLLMVRGHLLVWYIDSGRSWLALSDKSL